MRKTEIFVFVVGFRIFVRPYPSKDANKTKSRHCLSDDRVKTSFHTFSEVEEFTQRFTIQRSMTGLPKSSFQPVYTDTPQFPISHNLKLHKTEPGYDRTCLCLKALYLHALECRFP
jgi:hypothetical protein